MDDIPIETPSSETERSIKPQGGSSRRSVGPESETRGGPEAVDETLDDDSEKAEGSGGSAKAGERPPK